MEILPRSRRAVFNDGFGIQHLQAPSLTLSLSYREQQNYQPVPATDARGPRRLDVLQPNDRLVGSQFVVLAVALSFLGHQPSVPRSRRAEAVAMWPVY